MILEIRDVRFSYNSTEVLRGVTFEVRSGEVLGIVGPNGCGKTTLLRCLNNVLSPKGGVVLIDGQPVSFLTRKDIARKIGRIPQHFTTSFSFSVLDVVLMGREPHLNGLGEEAEQDLNIAENAMEWTSILHLADRSIGELSGGEMQRVIIARALTQQPQILLMDEPTSHLDIKHQLEILQLTQRLTNERNLITLLVSHDLNMAARYCDKLVVLNQGKIAAAGPAKDVLTPDLVREVYQVDAVVYHHPLTGCVAIDYLSSATIIDKAEEPHSSEALLEPGICKCQNIAG